MQEAEITVKVKKYVTEDKKIIDKASGEERVIQAIKLDSQGRKRYKIETRVIHRLQDARYVDIIGHSNGAIMSR